MTKKQQSLCVMGFVMGILLMLPMGTSADTTISSDITATTTWTTAGGVYIISGQRSISSGVTLTIEPGVIVKFGWGKHGLTVNGTLNASGTAADPIYFTSIHDDTVGGDTNGNGTSTGPGASQWLYMRVNSGGVADLKHAVVRYAGYQAMLGAARPTFHANGGTLTVSSSTITQGVQYGVMTSSGTTTIASSTINNHEFYGVYGTGGVFSLHDSTISGITNGLPIYVADPDILLSSGNNTATGNMSNATRIAGGSLSSDRAWEDSMPYVIPSSGGVTIDSGKTLTLQSGTIVKLYGPNSSIVVNGTLNAQGTSLEPVYFTSLIDDAAGGDTYGDGGVSSPSPGEWLYIRINSGGVANLEHAVVRYGGATNSPNVYTNIYNNGGILNIATSTIMYAAQHGILQGAGTTTVIASDIAFNTYGLYLAGGNMSLAGISKIHDNSSYGAFNELTATSSFFAENNYWATATATATSGPYHPTFNPSGTGDQVSSYIDFDPWVGKSGTSSLPHYVRTDAYAVQPGVCLVPYFASTTYSGLLTNAVDEWNSLPRMELVATSSLSSMWVIDIHNVNRSDLPWRGQTTFGHIVDPSFDATTTIELNSYYLDNDDSDSRTQKTIAHELGHVLGLDHSFTGNIMDALSSLQTSLGSQDELDYDHQWSSETQWSNVCP